MIAKHSSLGGGGDWGVYFFTLFEGSGEGKREGKCVVAHLLFPHFAHINALIILNYMVALLSPNM